ncbi:hypothetical protein [Aeromonas caviae]|uniref:hypothetical protein n=1 Tax=Aeromonas caviae TaxID=648 RepID=UPI002B4A7746|nr:hypothetical protein [Aeromonas caviae]
MNINALPFCTTNWAEVPPTEHKGERGVARWHTRQFGELRTELQDGRVFTLTPGMSYQVADNAEPHRSYTELGARLFIVD